MKMPGFTAEAAVYDSHGLTYGMAGAMDAPSKGAVVMPQACISRTVTATASCCTKFGWPPVQCCFRVCLPIVGCKSICIP
jgi:hypothetical protein